MFPTTSTRESIEWSLDTTAHLEACLEAIQSLCLAPFSLTRLNSVIENGSKLLKTTEAHFWRHPFSSCKWKMGYSTKFSWYPLPANSTYGSWSTCDPPTRETIDTEWPGTLRSYPRTAASRLPSPLFLLSTATPTLLNVSQSHLRTKTRVASDPSLNSTRNWPNKVIPPTTREKIWGNIPSRKTDCKQKTAMRTWIRYVIFWNWYVFYTRQIRILTSTSFCDQHISIFMQLAVRRNCA